MSASRATNGRPRPPIEPFASAGRNGHAEHEAPPAAANGRDKSGKFVKGNAGGPGCKFARQVAARRQALLEAISPADIAAVARKLYEQAQAGDVPAAKVLLTFVLGRPAEAADPDTLDQREFRALAGAPSLREMCVAQGRYAPAFAVEVLRGLVVSDEAGHRKVLHKALSPLKERHPYLAETIDSLIDRADAALGPVLKGLIDNYGS